ncbi:TetR/AcrR family transcriptional regulator [Spirosoma sp. KNUC1025]|uniref:TetR/AcrR family transcriptional regulator n=1 Tax=Spirosoma sp. KNUC1025 TaxID=2894082 RepID=UPI00386A140E|nr:TetR/AcrR family transcriptional regulator [Spirosoma sp. KNUC1025]
MLNTKERILQASIRLFNEFGIDHVRLYQIAEVTGISVGNLVYHYKNKEAIIESINGQITEEFSAIVRQYLQQPGFVDFDYQIAQFYRFFGTYCFYIAEFLKTTPSSLESRTLWQELVNRMLIQLQSRLDFHVKRSDLVAPPAKEVYEALAESIWTTLVFYQAHCAMKGIPCDEASYKNAVWRHVKPYFTEQGAAEFTTIILPLLV